MVGSLGFPGPSSQRTKGATHVKVIGAGPCFHMIDVMRMIDRLIWQGTHIEDVKRTVPADRLLVYEVGDGWGPLAA